MLMFPLLIYAACELLTNTVVNRENREQLKCSREKQRCKSESAYQSNEDRDSQNKKMNTGRFREIRRYIVIISREAGTIQSWAAL
jgi:hypothetical protein